MTATPNLRYLLSINSENAWSDLLATLMDADQMTTRHSLGIAGDAPLVIRREVAKSRARKLSDRPDLVVESDGRTVAVIEVKLLAGLGDEQLERYYRYVDESDREGCRFLAVSLLRLRLNTEHAVEWDNRTWEGLLDPFVSSSVPWVATTAAAWLRHIAATVSAVDGATVWNQVEGDDLYLGLRLRSAYLRENVGVPPGSSSAVQEIGSGGLYAAMVDAPVPGSSYTVRWEATEHLPTQDVGKLTDGSGLRGPEVRFFLVQQNVTSSRTYDWDHLNVLWREYLAAEHWIPWRAHPPRKKLPWEIDGVARLRQLGSPVFLGYGFGERQAALSGEVHFGARFVLPPTATLAEVTDMLSRVAVIGSRMAMHPMAPRTAHTE
ncbi:PD-(D/E)XK nuclease family protein [Streptomyces sp. CA-111067]|uniref:PD-(D/E)XK nuclease family protein n=1 Tax=Streptomyces sp. CA-111067 TaxID=3240046 RepID=UPI003D98CA2F